MTMHDFVIVFSVALLPRNTVFRCCMLKVQSNTKHDIICSNRALLQAIMWKEAHGRGIARARVRRPSAR